MRLTPKEQEKLLLHMAGMLAKERKERGLKLNYVEAVPISAQNLWRWPETAGRSLSLCIWEQKF